MAESDQKVKFGLNWHLLSARRATLGSIEIDFYMGESSLDPKYACT